MKLLKPLSLLLLVFVLQSCNLAPSKPGIWKNDKIEAGKREKFHELNDQLLKNIKAVDNSSIESMLSRTLLESNYKRPVELIGNHMKEGTYSLFNEYYMVNDVKDNTFKSPNTDSLDINYSAVAKEMYIAFLLPKEPENKYMITIVYGKFDYGWKVDKLEIAKYSENGKNTAELYQEARAQYAKGYLINSANDMAMAHNCGDPSEELNPLFDRNMHIFYQNLVIELNKRYTYPLVITGVSTRPQIFRVDNQDAKGGTYPAVCYLSLIDMKDTAALKKENNEVKKVIGRIMPGIDKDKKYMLYNIYNEKPNLTSNAYSYDITVKL
ncbi:hypothetical protein [Mucilaginibacter jinjuensis]|uniref:DUF3828 domain-containing protein n=1 Tax=Mucilaginibacter jinjuensis TaxID=1176721 RepID=A0ABY7T8G1_9SPHI|nr:hypothetical protein [Mucilaginibacter jinjuensis]WCT12519.1 hypothetical protein PQO05_01065 [Mucilaginibacter jinjuensis]